MAAVAPFRALRYNSAKIERLEDVFTPPYDIISAGDGEKLRQKNPYSMINLDLRNTSQGETEDDGRYQQARDRFAAWQDESVLIRDAQPAMYLYNIEYQHPNGRRLTRKGLVCLVGLAEFSEGIVRPHEKTFAGVIGDRLKLMETCEAQFSKIFSIYSDPQQEVIRTLEQAQEDAPVLQTKDGSGNTHSLWRVTDAAAIATVRQFFADRPVYIADGHHRYTTALEYRRRALAANPALPADHPSQFIMMYLCGCEDPGLSVLPTHRLVRWPGAMSADALAERMQSCLRVEEVTSGSRESLMAETLNRMDEAAKDSSLPAFGVYHAGENRAFLLAATQATFTASPALADKPEVLRTLDVVLLSEVLINHCLGLSHEQCAKDKLISYLSDPDEAFDAAVKESVVEDGHTPLLLLLNPTKVEQVLRVADSGNIMPHKSTFFYPKILTGLLIRKLDEAVCG
jgi:uncharacterized protein (DUF1015 family)